MPADEPTVVATSGGHRLGQRIAVEFDALVHHAVDLSGAHGRRPRIMYVGTAIGDAEHFTARMHEAARVAGFDLTPLHLFPMPNTEDVEGAVLGTGRRLGHGRLGREPAGGVAGTRP